MSEQSESTVRDGKDLAVEHPPAADSKLDVVVEVEGNKDDYKRSWTTMRGGSKGVKRTQSKKGEAPPPPVEYTCDEGVVYPSRSAFKKHVKKLGKVMWGGQC
jgi:hypothetical protein